MIGLNNKKIGFIVDTSSTIKNGDYEDVAVLPLGINVVENGSTKTYQDGVNFNNDDLKRILLDKKSEVKTSQANMSEMMKIAQKMCSQYDYVIVKLDKIKKSEIKKKLFLNKTVIFMI